MGYWLEEIDKEDIIKDIESNDNLSTQEIQIVKSKLSEKVKHYLVFDDDLVKEYMEFSNEEEPILIAQLNTTVSHNKIKIYHPADKNQTISEILIGKSGKPKLNESFLFVNKEINFQADQFNYQVAKVAPRWVRSLCMYACRKTHRALGLDPEIDSICCFWLP